MEEKYREYSDALFENKKCSPDEAGHQEADGLMCKIAISASLGDLTKEEVSSLIELYESISKWYA